MYLTEGALLVGKRLTDIKDPPPLCPIQQQKRAIFPQMTSMYQPKKPVYTQKSPLGGLFLWIRGVSVIM